MFKYKRESLFIHESVRSLESLDEDTVESYYSVCLELSRAQNLIDVELKRQSQFYFETGEVDKLKEIVRFRRYIKQNKISEVPVFLSDEISKSIDYFKMQMKTKKDLEEIITKKIFNEKLDYQYFLSNPYFKKSIMYTNPKAYCQIFDTKKFDKRKYDKTRYSYIQRNVLKTNSLSWMGVTTFENKTNKSLNESFCLNKYFLTALLFLCAKDSVVQNHLKFRTGTISKLEGYSCFVHNRYYSSSFSNSFLVREDVLFNEQLVDFLKKIEFEDTKGVAYVKQLMDRVGIDLDFLLNNNLLIPDFEYYDNVVNLKELLSYSENFNKISYQIFDKKNAHNLIKLDSNLRKDLATHDSYYFEKSLIAIIEEEPIWQNVVSKENDSKFVNIFDTNFSRYEELLKCIKVNNHYAEIISLIKELSEDGNTNVLEIFLKIESEIIYQNDYWDTAKKTKPLEIESLDLGEKSLMIMFNIKKDKEVVITNVFPGNGFLVGREFSKMSDDIFSLYHSFLSDQYPDNSKIYEVVITPEISSLINTGQSRYPKLFWPRDFKNVTVHFQDKKISFVYKGEKITPVYFGSIPIHFFSGAVGLFLKAISPWGMIKNIKKSIKEINNREEILITKSDINSIFISDKKKSYLNLLLYFKEKNFPLQFFLEETGRKLNKPIFITLLSIEGFELFKKTVERNGVIISELSPTPKDTLSGEKLYEYINVITEKDIKNYVDKLSHL